MTIETPRAVTWLVRTRFFIARMQRSKASTILPLFFTFQLTTWTVQILTGHVTTLYVYVVSLTMVYVYYALWKFGTVRAHGWWCSLVCIYYTFGKWTVFGFMGTDIAGLHMWANGEGQMLGQRARMGGEVLHVYHAFWKWIVDGWMCANMIGLQQWAYGDGGLVTMHA